MKWNEKNEISIQPFVNKFQRFAAKYSTRFNAIISPHKSLHKWVFQLALPPPPPDKTTRKNYPGLPREWYM